MKAEKIINNGKLYSVLMDGSEIRAEALAIADGRILSLGTNEEISQLVGPDTEVIDAGGNTVLPAFTDSHCHSSCSGSKLFSCDLFGLPGKATDAMKELKSRLAAYVKANPDAEIIKGCGWDFAVLGTKADRKILDEICSDRPVALESYCQHHLWVNTKALEHARITDEIEDVKDGSIHRDKKGRLTGVFSEFSAMDLLKSRIPDYDYSVEEYKEIIRKYQTDFANAYGVTMIFDALSSANAKEAFRQMAQAEQLTIRICDNEYADPTKPMSQFDDMIARKGQADVDDLYRVTTVKFFMESNIPDMCFLKPYKPLAMLAFGKPIGYKGYLFWDKEELQQIIPKLVQAGFQIHTHAMGDGAVKQTVDAYEYGYKSTGIDSRNVIAHLMLVDDEDYSRMADCHTLACVQPRWMAMTKSEMSSCRLALGNRVENFHPYRRFLDAGVIVSAGTDFPVTPPPDPFIDIEHAMTRTLSEGAPEYDGKGAVLAPKHDPDIDKVSLKEAIKSRTISGAYQCFAEDFTGSLEVGKSADIIILDTDIENVPAQDIHKTNVNYTLFKGNIVYQAL